MDEDIAFDHSLNYSSQEKRNLYDELDPSKRDAPVFSELFNGGSLLELCNSFWMRSPGTKNDVQPYLRGCKWSPDGTCCLSVVNHDGFHIMELPRDLYDGCPTRDQPITLLSAAIHVKEAGLVYDFCWYPKMNSQVPETCSWISTKTNSPIQMWDAYDGSLRCSYRGFNAVDEMEPALSVTFTQQGERIVGGYKNCLRTFDVERPGRDFYEYKTKLAASCLATHGNLLAVGSWNSNIKLFSILDGGTYKSIGNLNAHTGGITHLQFTPDGTKLVSGARKDHNIYVWDIRYYRRPLNILKRCVSTNQRIYFDISSCGRYLVSGGTDGVIRVWDETYIKWAHEFNVRHDYRENATFRFRLYQDCCNSVSIHPSRPILATGSGQYHLVDPVEALERERDTNESSENQHTAKYVKLEVDFTSNQLAVQEEENYTDVSNEIHVEKNTNEIGLAENQQISGNNETNDRVSVINSAKEEFFGKIQNINIIEDSPFKRDASESVGEESAHKKTKLDITINSPSKIHVSENTSDVPVNVSHDQETAISPANQVNIENEPPNIEPFSEDSTDAVNSVVFHGLEPPSSEPKLNNVNKITFPLLEEDSEPPNKESSTEDSTEAVNKNVYHGSDPPLSELKLNNVSKMTSPLPKEDNNNQHASKTNEPSDKTNKLTNSSRESPPSNNSISSTASECEMNDDSKVFSLRKPFKLNEIERPPRTKAPNLVFATKESDSKSYRIIDIEADDDCKDINVNQMKYSSYAENNLTFWWLAKISDS